MPMTRPDICRSPRYSLLTCLVGVASCALALSACTDVVGMNAMHPARGPGQMVGNGEPVSDGDFEGGNDPNPEARDVPAGEEGTCDGACEDYCDSLDLQNPVNRGICSQLWGAGWESRPIDRKESCRRIFIDMIGRAPTPSEVNDVCSMENWGDVAKNLMERDEFIRVQQLQWADNLLYNNRAVNVERAFDMDDLVKKAYQGKVGWDLFAAVTASHPILVRRHDTPGDRVEAVFRLFLGRPPYDNERSDLGRLYAVWANDYVEHAHLGTLPDAYIQYPCVDENTGKVTQDSTGGCTSVLWGLNVVALERDDSRVNPDGLTWSGQLTADDWEVLQTPGRLLSQHPALSQTFWEHTVDQALIHYFGYDLGTKSPGVREELRKYLLQYNGDIRSLHFGIVTSAIYQQSNHGGVADAAHPWRFGPLKQMQVEAWIDSVNKLTGHPMGQCDHRLPHPEDYLEPEFNNWAYAMVKATRWVVQDGEVRSDYRELAQTLGGCPTNEVNGRFTTVSILNTAIQEGFLVTVCGLSPDGGGVSAENLLPEGMAPNTALTPDVAKQVFRRQVRLFYGRDPNNEELDEAAELANECSPKPCDAEEFARPVCFALLSASEMLFY